VQIVAQLNTFILAAFESTAAAIVYTIYYIAQHPSVEARLVQELKAAQQSAGGEDLHLNWDEVCDCSVRCSAAQCSAARWFLVIHLRTYLLTWLGHNLSTPPLNGCEPARLIGDSALPRVALLCGICSCSSGLWGVEHCDTTYLNLRNVTPHTCVLRWLPLFRTLRCTLTIPLF
jgi:hypothetical protein